MHDPDAVDPDILAARARQGQFVTPFDITALSSDEGRRRANDAALFFNDGAPAVFRVETRMIDGPAGPLRARIFQPHATPPHGAVLYLHGGGWVACDVDTHDGLMRRLALDSELLVVGIDYRLAPEHPFPAPLMDVIAAWRWLGDHAQAFGVDPARVGVTGDSAGATLGMGLSVSERDAGRAPPRAAAFFYGCFAPRFDTESHARHGDGRFGLTSARMRWYWRQFLGDDINTPPRLAAPRDADLAGLGAHYLCIADLDPIADDSRALARQLTACGVDVEIDTWAGAVHGFMQMGRDVPLARAAIAQAGAFLKRRV